MPETTVAPSPAAITRHLRIQGRVQGVYYRQSTVETAQRLALRGWVRNRHDGTVEALVHGPAEAVQALVAWAHQGPERARVDAVDVAEVPAPDDLDSGFSQRDTA